MHCWCFAFLQPLHYKNNRFFTEYGDVFFKFGDDIGRCFLTQISEEISDSPKSVRENLLYSGDEKMFFFSIFQWSSQCYKVHWTHCKIIGTKKNKGQKCSMKKMWFTKNGEKACTEFNDSQGNSPNSVIN